MITENEEKYIKELYTSHLKFLEAKELETLNLPHKTKIIELKKIYPNFIDILSIANTPEEGKIGN